MPSDKRNPAPGERGAAQIGVPLGSEHELSISPRISALQAAFIVRRFRLTAQSAAIVASLAFGEARHG
jgi:hypothetical protein